MQLDFSKCDGMVPAIVQDHQDGRVLMLGFMDQAAFDKTVSTGKVTFFSRTRNKLWTKGETSGHYLLLKRMEVDCDLDTVLVHAEAAGPGVCHAGYRSCFYRTLDAGDWKVTDEQTYDPGKVFGR
ncbi:MAG: phosphoribosyl-AMP cyclohydrolase [Bryobacterales bacterium]|nr:phosphoribosyl-AMP cyclohydrolase [Bryobacterales bacterium]